MDRAASLWLPFAGALLLLGGCEHGFGGARGGSSRFGGYRESPGASARPSYVGSFGGGAPSGRAPTGGGAAAQRAKPPTSLALGPAERPTTGARAHPVAGPAAPPGSGPAARAGSGLAPPPAWRAPGGHYGFWAPAAARPVSVILDLLELLADAASEDWSGEPATAIAPIPPIGPPPGYFFPPAGEEPRDPAPPAPDPSVDPMPPAPDFYGADLGADSCADVAPGSPAPRGCERVVDPLKASGSGAAGSRR